MNQSARLRKALEDCLTTADENDTEVQFDTDAVLKFFGGMSKEDAAAFVLTPDGDWFTITRKEP